jgi:hypothetical protein
MTLDPDCSSRPDSRQRRSVTEFIKEFMRNLFPFPSNRLVACMYVVFVGLAISQLFTSSEMEV